VARVGQQQALGEERAATGSRLPFKEAGERGDAPMSRGAGTGRRFRLALLASKISGRWREELNGGSGLSVQRKERADGCQRAGESSTWVGPAQEGK